METRDESTDLPDDAEGTGERYDRTTDAPGPSGPGDVLGISHVEPGRTGEIHSREQDKRDQGDDDGRITPLEDEVDLGARDVTKTGRGETGPETGGHGATPQRSGATGTDIGG